MGFEYTWRSEVVGLGVVLYIVTFLILRSRVTRIPTWSIMAFSSFITVVTGLIQFDEIGSVIDMDVVLFLIGMFSLVSLAESSGLLSMLRLGI